MTLTTGARRLRGAAALAATAGLLLGAAPASGWLRDFGVAQGDSATSSSVVKSLNVQCPAGSLTLGASALVSPSFGSLGLAYLAPPPAATFARVGGSETDPVAGDWTLRGRAFCARNVGTAPPLGGGARYVKAVRIVRSQSGLGSQATRTVTARCPTGKTAISGGGRLEPLSPSLAFTSMQRLAGGGAWQVQAHETDPFASAWQVHATAICANVATETATGNYAGPTLFGPDLVGSTSSDPLQSVSRSCPAGTSVVGGGSAVLPVSGQARPGDVVLMASEPAGSGTVAGAWLAIARESDPTSRPWRVAVRVLCAPLTGGPPA